ncbi:MAG: imelysin family protein [Verrucomicrobiota bacterium JB024]|nr:imelysin family protein [Verrucomicrobiota bacterium JB024]
MALVMPVLLGGVCRAQPTEPEVLAALVNDAAQPCLAQVANTAVRLEAAVNQLCEKPDLQTLTRARAAWTEAYLAWRQAAPFLFGPGKKLDRLIGKWQVNAVVLDAAVESPDLSDLLKQVEQRGYAAIEYLLFTPRDAAAATTPGRCAHLHSLTAEIARLTSAMKQEWDATYGAELVAAGNGEPFLIPADALSVVFTQTLNATEQMLRDRISVPSGYFQDAVKPENLEAWRSGNTRAGLQATLAGLRLIITGGGDTSVVTLVATRDGLVEKRSPVLAKAIVKQLDKIDVTLAGFDGDGVQLEDELKKNPRVLKPLYRQLQTLQDQLVEASLVLELDVYSPAPQSMAAATQ